MLLKRLVSRYERFPELLSIELSTHCNSNCIMCPRSRLTRPIENMSDDVLDTILTECGKTPPRKANLFWFGDSLCHPNIIPCLRKIRAAMPKTKLYLSTNAGMLKSGKADTILEEGLLDVINFDIDGVTKETYEKIRIGPKFDRVIENTRYFIRRKRELKLRKPQVRLTIIRMKETADEVDAFRKQWSGEADSVDVNDYNTWLGDIEERNVGATLDKSVGGAFRYPCIHPWNELVIAADGAAGLCCLDYDITAPLGNIHEKSIREIWTGATLRGYREKLVNLDYDSIACCKNCNAYIYQDNTYWAQLWRANT